MKLQLNRETLLKPLQQVMGVVERKQTLPILSNVLLKTKDHMLSVTGTDLEIELIGNADLTQKNAPAQITLPGRKLIDICKALPEGAPIELYEDKGRMTLRSGRSRFMLSTLPVKEFPSLEEQEYHLQFTIPQQELRQLLTRTQFCMAQQDVRYYLNGMLFEITPKVIRTVATDGHRLAINSLPINIKDTPRLQVIIPRKGIMELLRLLEDRIEPVEVAIGHNHIRISSKACVFTSKLVDGRFPDYSHVVPRNNNKQVAIDRNVFKQTLNRAAILCNEKFHGVRLEFRNNLLRIFANNPEQEAAEEEINIEYNGEDVDIGFNVNYLIDILNTVNEGNVLLNFSDGNNSILIEEANFNNESLFVVMPMRL